MKTYNRLADFFKNEYRNLVRYVQKKVERLADLEAEDIVQEVMVSLVDRADVTQPIENLAAYVYGSLKNRLIDSFRIRRELVSLDSNGRSSNGEHLAGVVADLEQKYVSESENKTRISLLYKALDSLADRDRAIVIATEMEGYSFAELSQKWGEPVGTLLARKSRALKKIKQKLAVK